MAIGEINDQESNAEQNPYTKSNKGLPTEITVHAILNIIHQIGSKSTVFTRKAKCSQPSAIDS